MADLKKTELTLEQRAFELAKALLIKYHNPNDLELDENANLDDSYTLLITLL